MFSCCAPSTGGLCLCPRTRQEIFKKYNIFSSISCISCKFRPNESCILIKLQNETRDFAASRYWVSSLLIMSRLLPGEKCTPRVYWRNTIRNIIDIHSLKMPRTHSLHVHTAHTSSVYIKIQFDVLIAILRYIVGNHNTDSARTPPPHIRSDRATNYVRRCSFDRRNLCPINFRSSN